MHTTYATNKQTNTTIQQIKHLKVQEHVTIYRGRMIAVLQAPTQPTSPLKTFEVLVSERTHVPGRTNTIFMINHPPGQT